MKAVRIHQFGGPEVLNYESVPDPKPRKDQVLIRVRACALNHLDIWVRNGIPGVNLPHILGTDTAGEIVEVGEYITDLKVGQRVLVAPMSFCNHCAKCVAGLQNQCRQFTVFGNAVDGGNCELFAIPAVNAIPIPDSLDFNEAASVPLVFVTAWHMLVGRAAIRPGKLFSSSAPTPESESPPSRSPNFSTHALSLRPATSAKWSALANSARIL